MAEANQLFGDSYIERVRESVASEQIASSKLIQSGIKHYRKLIEYIKANNTIEPKRENAQLLRQISEIVAKHNDLINTRIMSSEVCYED